MCGRFSLVVALSVGGNFSQVVQSNCTETYSLLLGLSSGSIALELHIGNESISRAITERIKVVCTAQIMSNFVDVSFRTPGRVRCRSETRFP